MLEEGQLPPLDTPQERTNNNASFQQCMSGMLELQQGARKLTGDFNAAVKEGQDKKRYSDAVCGGVHTTAYTPHHMHTPPHTHPTTYTPDHVPPQQAIKRNRNRTSPAAFMFVLQSAIAFLEAALLAQHSNKTSTSDIVMLLQQTLIMLEACLSKEDTSMPPTQLLAFKLVARKLMTAIAMRIAQISRPSGKDAAKQVLNAARDPTVRDPFRDKPSPGDSNVSSETSNGRAHSLLHDCATKCADLVLVQARVIEYASLSAQLQASFAAEMQRGRAKEGATLAMHAQMLGADLAAGSGEVLLHVARQTLGVLEGFVNAMEAKM